MASDNDLGNYLNLAQKIGHEDVTCMDCKHYAKVPDFGYCYPGEKNCNLDTPAYDCPSFEYDEHSMPKEAYEEKKKEEELKKQDNSIDINDKDLTHSGNFTFAAIVCIFCIISLAFVLSKAKSGFEAAFDIVIGIIVTGVLTYLAYKG